MSSPQFSSRQRVILIACGVIMVLGLGVLAIDKFVVPEGEPSKADRLSRLAEEFDLSEGDAEDRARLEKLLKSVAAQSGASEPAGQFLFREDETHTLWLFEYEALETAIRRLGRPDSSVNVTLFGILFELKGADELPAWEQESNTLAPTPPFNLSSLGILSRLSDYRVSIKGTCILLTTFIETWALKQAVNQQTSAEFHAGLYNSAMKVDVQSAVQMVNAMDTGAPPVPSFYALDIDIDIAIPRSTGISNRLSEINREVHEKVRAQIEQANQEIRAASEQASQEQAALLEEQRQLRKARMEESKKRLAALREAQRKEMDAIRTQAQERRTETEALESHAVPLPGDVVADPERFRGKEEQ